MLRGRNRVVVLNASGSFQQFGCEFAHCFAATLVHFNDWLLLRKQAQSLEYIVLPCNPIVVLSLASYVP
jgi:hypothetical protein